MYSLRIIKLHSKLQSVPILKHLYSYRVLLNLSMAYTPDNTNYINLVYQRLLQVLCFCVTCAYLFAKEIFYAVKEKPLTSVKDDIVLITGSGHGIGKELAKKYASLEATVVCWDINKENNETTVQEIKQLGYSKVYAYVCDVSNSKEVEKVAEQVKIEVGCVTILINNAGVAYIKTILDTNYQQIENTMKVNTIAHFWTIKAFLPGMQEKNHGHIVAISSIAGLYGSTNGTAYCASKFAVGGLMKSLQHELGINPHNKINITLIYPAGVVTGMFKKARIRFPKLTPFVTPEEMAEYAVKAQRQNCFELSVPRKTLIVNKIIGPLPTKAQNAILDFFDICVIE